MLVTTLDSVFADLIEIIPRHIITTHQGGYGPFFWSVIGVLRETHERGLCPVTSL